MERIYIKAKAKINLTLNVLNKRDDGYHNLESVFQKINLYDEIYIEKKEEGFELETNFKEIKQEDNIIYKAYMKLKDKYPKINGIKIKLNKNIPTQAGLAGGSTDCASVIKGINKIYDLKMTFKEMCEIGSSLGADVVPCMYKGCVKAEGIGDVITPIDAKNIKLYILIIKPKFTCNTGKMFKLIDEKNIGKEKNSNELIKYINSNDILGVSKQLYNVFEEVIEQQETLNKVKEEFLINNALGTLLTGSGSCIYGIYEKKEEAKKAYNNLREKYNIYYTITNN